MAEEDKVWLITGCSSGMGREFAFAALDAGYRVVTTARDPKTLQAFVEAHPERARALALDVTDKRQVEAVVAATIAEFGRIDVLVNNAAEQHPASSIEEIDEAQLDRTFRTNIYGMFFLVKAALPHIPEGGAIVNTTSVTAYKGSPQLLDYSATKGAIVAFTRSLSLALAERGIRVNAVAPGPIWTPLIPSTFPADRVASHGEDVPMGRAGQPNEVAPAYVYLASADGSYVSGQVLHVNGGTVVNG